MFRFIGKEQVHLTGYVNLMGSDDNVPDLHVTGSNMSNTEIDLGRLHSLT